eukprot:1178285-Prorocentrum_minimum.AAC.4
MGEEEAVPDPSSSEAPEGSVLEADPSDDVVKSAEKVVLTRQDVLPGEVDVAPPEPPAQQLLPFLSKEDLAEPKPDHPPPKYPTRVNGAEDGVTYDIWELLQQKLQHQLVYYYQTYKEYMPNEHRDENEPEPLEVLTPEIDSILVNKVANGYDHAVLISQGPYPMPPSATLWTPYRSLTDHPLLRTLYGPPMYPLQIPYGPPPITDPLRTPYGPPLEPLCAVLLGGQQPLPAGPHSL